MRMWRPGLMGSSGWQQNKTSCESASVFHALMVCPCREKSSFRLGRGGWSVGGLASWSVERPFSCYPEPPLPPPHFVQLWRGLDRRRERKGRRLGRSSPGGERLPFAGALDL